MARLARSADRERGDIGLVGLERGDGLIGGLLINRARRQQVLVTLGCDAGQVEVGLRLRELGILLGGCLLGLGECGVCPREVGPGLLVEVASARDRSA